MTRRFQQLQLRERAGDFNPSAAITVMTVRVSKGLKCPVVAMPGVGQVDQLHAPAGDARRAHQLK